MTLLNAIHNAFPEQSTNSKLKLIEKTHNLKQEKKLFIAKTASQLIEL